MKVSVVIPVFNEYQSLQELHKRLLDVVAGIKQDWEIIYVDDGSSDDSYQLLENFSKEELGQITAYKFIKCRVAHSVFSF